MKKEMFNVWYNKYGKELAKNALPIDDVDEKEIRRKAKKIFSLEYTHSIKVGINISVCIESIKLNH